MVSNKESPKFMAHDENFEDLHSHLSNHDCVSETTAFTKEFHEHIPEIIVIDSTEDESEHSMIKLKIRKHKCKKNHRKLKTYKKKITLDSPILKELPQTPFQTYDQASQGEIVNEKPILPLVPEKDIKIGQKYQAFLPPFQLKQLKPEKSAWSLQEIMKNKVWEPNVVSAQEFEECKKLIQMILDLNYLTDDIVCKFLVMHSYNVEQTINYCIVNKNTLQTELINSFVPQEPLFRKTRNSVYNKFLLTKF